MQREFFSIIREKNEAGATVFMSSHVLSEVQHNCTRAAVIREGSIIACDSIDALAKTSAKRVSVRGSVELGGLGGIRDLKSSGEALSFLYNGDVRSLLRRLSEADISDLSISEPDLEEIFMHYYEKEGGEA